jgi:hypothetical protein
MALGGLLAVLDRRYRLKARVPVTSPMPRGEEAAPALAGQAVRP